MRPVGENAAQRATGTAARPFLEVSTAAERPVDSPAGRFTEVVWADSTPKVG